MTDANYFQPFEPRLHPRSRLRLSLSCKNTASLMETSLLACVVMIGTLCCVAQTQAPPASSSETPPQNAALRDLQSQVRELKQLVLQLQQQTVDSHAEITKLRQELESRGNGPDGGGVGDRQSSAYIGSSSDQLGQRLDHIEEDQQLLSGKINDQVSDKGRERVQVPHPVLGNRALQPVWQQWLGGKPGRAHLGDTPLSLPTLPVRWAPPCVSRFLASRPSDRISWGRTPAPTSISTSAAASRLPITELTRHSYGCVPPLCAWTGRTRRSSRDRTSCSCHQSRRRHSPSVIVPALSYAGNLWAWTPQLRVEHRFAMSGNSTIALQGAFMDPLTGEPPDSDYYTWYRAADAGEQSRQPAYASTCRLFQADAGTDFHRRRRRIL